ncbi:response regulator [bacterium]|nr:response regulator [bacterium]
MEPCLTSGPTALRRLRENGFTAPVIAMTAHAMNEHREEYMSIGFDGYISKPVDQQVLVRLICALSGSRGPLL